MRVTEYKKIEARPSDQEETAPSSVTDNQIIASNGPIDTRGLIEDMVFPFPPVGTVEDVAELLKLPTSSVRSLCRTGQLKGFKVGNLWRISRASLLAFIKEGGC